MSKNELQEDLEELMTTEKILDCELEKPFDYIITHSYTYIPNASSCLMLLVPLTYSHLTIMNTAPRTNTAMRINGLEATASAIIPQKNEVILKEKNGVKLIIHDCTFLHEKIQIHVFGLLVVINM